MAKLKAHKLATGWRRISESKCSEPGCEFFGKRAQQGVCFDVLNKTTDAYITMVRKHADAYLGEMKALREVNKLDTDAKWIKYLEGQFKCQVMNEQFTLDQLIYLRAQVGKLESKLGKRK